MRWVAGVFTDADFEAGIAPDADTALRTVAAWNPDLIVCDLRVAGMESANLCRRIRQISAVPVIVVSANASARERIEVLDAGADDFLTLPVPPEELRARIRALLRRVSPRTAEREPVASSGDFVLVNGLRRVSVRGRELRLTCKEFALLSYLLQNPWRVLSYDVIHIAVWGPTHNTARERVRDLVAQLRQKIEPNLDDPTYIITEHGVGYHFQPSADCETRQAAPVFAPAQTLPA
jgi:two-component system KDP operon response regulator KdpE